MTEKRLRKAGLLIDYLKELREIDNMVDVRDTIRQVIDEMNSVLGITKEDEPKEPKTITGFTNQE